MTTTRPSGSRRWEIAQGAISGASRIASARSARGRSPGPWRSRRDFRAAQAPAPARRPAAARRRACARGRAPAHRLAPSRPTAATAPATRRPSPRCRVNRRFDPSGPLRGTLRAPGDKSMSHRAALFGAMCDDPVQITGYLEAADTYSTLNAVRALGALVEEGADRGTLTVRGPGLRAAAEAHIDVGNAGTLMRLAPGWLAGQPGGEWTLDGDASIRRRPVDRVAMPLREMGAWIDAHDGRFAPVHGARHAAARDRVRAARRLRAGQVLRADGGPARVRHDHGDRARAEPRPHRAPARPRGRAHHARRRPDRAHPARRARARRTSTCRATRRRPPSTSPRRSSSRARGSSSPT